MTNQVSTKNMNKKVAQQMTVKFSDINISKLSFTELEENERSKGQKMAYPRYEHPVYGAEHPLLIQLPWIHLGSYGIPRVGQYYEKDSDRTFIKVPLDQSIPEIKVFSDFLKNIDSKLSSQEFKEKSFGTKANKYIYQPIFRKPQEEEDDDIKLKKDHDLRHPYMKLKIDTTYPDNKILSIVFITTTENSKKVRTQVEDIVTIDDFAKYVCFMSRIHPIVRPVKLWAQSVSKKDPLYGLTFKLVKLELEQPKNNTSKIKEYLKVDGFLNSDSESEPENKKSNSTKLTTENNKESESESEDEIEDESDDSDDLNINPTPVKVTPKAKSKK
jgi:hypothetical protein